MSDRLQPRAGIRSYRKAAFALAGSTLIIGSGAQAQETATSAEVEVAAADQHAVHGHGHGGEHRGHHGGSGGHDGKNGERERGDADIVVTGERFRINTLNSRLPDVRDAPQSISIIPRAIIEQQSASTLRDVLRNVSGISMAAGEGGGGPAGDNLTLRGFGARNDIFVDGIRDFASYTRDTFNVEQVEVVKGPASAQTGRGSTGGYINLFSKQPQLKSFVGGTVGVGTPDFIRTTADLNLGGEDLGIGAGTAARVNLLYHDADTPGRDHVETKRFGIAPSVAVGLGTPTRAILSYMLLDQKNVPDYGIPFVPNTNMVLKDHWEQPAPVDYDNYYGLLERDREKTRTHLLTFALEHDVTDQIRIANTTRYGHATRDSIYSSPRFLNTTSTLITPQTQSRDTVDKVLFNQTNLFAKFETGGVRHDLIGGFEIADEKSRNQLRTITSGTPTDLFDPDPERPYNGTIVDLPGEIVRAGADSTAAYLFDTVHLSEQFLVTGGLRWERYKSYFRPASSQITATVGPIERTDTSLTWRAGMTYKPVPSLSLYAGAGTSVNPSIENMTQTTPTLAVGALKPERSRTYEVGAKWDGFRGRLLVTGALFRTDKTNARTPGLPGEPATVLEGKQRVDGVELTATGRITRGWSLIGSYTYLDTEVRESNTPAELGNRLANVPEHSGSIWSTYKLRGGIEFGGGLRYVGNRYTSVANTRDVGEYWLADATAAYEFRRNTTLRLNVFNLFDKRYIDQVGGGHFVPGTSRSAIATLAFGL